MLVPITKYVCSKCGAALSDNIMQSLHKKEIGDGCPICRNQPIIYRNSKLKKVFDDLGNIPDREFKVDAVFVENNGVSNPRLVIRFADDYFNDWNSLKIPDGFEIKRTRDEGICPIEMIYYFDVGHAITKDDFHHALNNALNNLTEWANNFPVLK